MIIPNEKSLRKYSLFCVSWGSSRWSHDRCQFDSLIMHHTLLDWCRWEDSLQVFVNDIRNRWLILPQSRRRVAKRCVCKTSLALGELSVFRHRGRTFRQNIDQTWCHGSPLSARSHWRILFGLVSGHCIGGIITVWHGYAFGAIACHSREDTTSTYSRH